ncbi:OmpA family protein [Haematospirillum jordaniae]|uniref:OmpA-like domain-containing protein n=1 Tax=Haematospirillum jordaniae TaxID=1549855 RepID=A0A143DES1_9PROT|nr:MULTISPECIES: OmpA family protein [Haematospirillum]AMW35166.1 hypothetical protein AY555_08245 [Haematospirillum jordaniae]NKD46145.1 OmpA family protein [Haematospirillum jordaniae]NKD56443.1 OmpA family protein [Haematospirillum jordaniae]NKD58501.1 OmpA family protein [Haematospirillum jordaniae]NKD66330.1 OmpA family protein [Haematospirillum jordaniae]
MMGNGNNQFSRPSPPADDESWIATFADMATLLLAFFILLAAISKIDAVAFEQVSAGMAKGVGKREIKTPTEDLKQQVQKSVTSLKMQDVVAISTDSQGIVMEMGSGSFFAPDSAELDESAREILAKIAATIGAEQFKSFQIEVQGHTDDSPPETPQYPSNWELSGARAGTVVRYFEEAGIPRARMKTVGMADTAPKVANRGPYGDVLPQNQAINRRVVVRVYPR